MLSFSRYVCVNVSFKSTLVNDLGVGLQGHMLHVCLTS